MVEMEAVYLDPGAVEGLFPVDGVSGNLLRCRISQLWQNDDNIHTSLRRRVDECYVTRRACGDVGGGFRKLGKETIGRGDWKMKPRSRLALYRMR